MPKLRTPAAEKENRTIIANIKYAMEMTGISQEELALAMRTSTVTLYSRYKHPENFRLKELRVIANKLRVPLDRLFA